MAAQYNMVPIPLDPDRIYHVTQSQLVAANDESIRLGFSRNLVEANIAQLPGELKFPILGVWNHTSGEGLRNIRLLILVGPNADDLHHCFVDVTPDTWAIIQGNACRQSAQQGEGVQ